MTTGQKIKHLRELSGITQVELAEKLDITRAAVYKYEKGLVATIPNDKIDALARILNTTPEYLLGFDESKTDNNTIASIVVRLKKDPIFLKVVELLYSLTDQKLEAVKSLLETFVNNSKH